MVCRRYRFRVWLVGFGFGSRLGDIGRDGLKQAVYGLTFSWLRHWLRWVEREVSRGAWERFSQML